MKCPYCERRVKDIPDHLLANEQCHARHQGLLRQQLRHVLEDHEARKQKQRSRPMSKHDPKLVEECRRAYVKAYNGIEASSYRKSVEHGIEAVLTLLAGDVDEDFPTVEIGDIIAQVLAKGLSPEETLDCLRQLFTASIKAIREHTLVPLTQVVVDWTFTAEVLSDEDMKEQLLEEDKP